MIDIHLNLIAEPVRQADRLLWSRVARIRICAAATAVLVVCLITAVVLSGFLALGNRSLRSEIVRTTHAVDVFVADSFPTGLPGMETIARSLEASLPWGAVLPRMFAGLDERVYINECTFDKGMFCAKGTMVASTGGDLDMLRRWVESLDRDPFLKKYLARFAVSDPQQRLSSKGIQLVDFVLIARQKGPVKK